MKVIFQLYFNLAEEMAGFTEENRPELPEESKMCSYWKEGSLPFLPSHKMELYMILGKDPEMTHANFTIRETVWLEHREILYIVIEKVKSWSPLLPEYFDSSIWNRGEYRIF